MHYNPISLSLGAISSRPFGQRKSGNQIKRMNWTKKPPTSDSQNKKEYAKINASKTVNMKDDFKQFHYYGTLDNAEEIQIHWIWRFLCTLSIHIYVSTVRKHNFSLTTWCCRLAKYHFCQADANYLTHKTSKAR